MSWDMLVPMAMFTGLAGLWLLLVVRGGAGG